MGAWEVGETVKVAAPKSAENCGFTIRKTPPLTCVVPVILRAPSKICVPAVRTRPLVPVKIPEKVLVPEPLIDQRLPPRSKSPSPESPAT